MKKQIAAFLCLVLVACSAPTPDKENSLPSPLQTAIPATAIPANASLPVATKTFPPATPVPAPTSLDMLHVGQALTITALYQMNASFGWGLEPGGHLLRTANEGETWRDVSPPGGFISADGFFPLTAKTAWVVPVSWCPAGMHICRAPQQDVVVWHTIDGGKNWQAGMPIDLGVSQLFFPSLYFLDAKNGWLLAELHRDEDDAAGSRELFRTTDGGATWRLLSDFTALPPFGAGLVFIDESVGWMGTSPLHDPLSVYQTTDGGHTWAAHPLSTSSFSGMDVSCRLDLTYIFWRSVGVGISCKNGPLPFYTWTSNSGQVWRTRSASGNEFFLDTERGWRMVSPAVGRPNLLQKTIDGGLTWSNLRAVEWQAVQLDFTDDNLGWGVAHIADRIALVHTSDGGMNWVEFKPVINRER